MKAVVLWICALPCHYDNYCKALLWIRMLRRAKTERLSQQTILTTWDTCATTQSSHTGHFQLTSVSLCISVVFALTCIQNKGYI